MSDKSEFFTSRDRPKVPGAEPKPGDEVPEADPDGLDYFGIPGLYSYRHRAHTERDMLRGGYFDPIMAKDANRYHGGLILYTMGGGSNDPEDWRTGFVRVYRVKGARGVSGQEPTRVAIVQRFGKATPAAHDGEAEPKTKPEKPGKKAKAA